VLKVSDQPTDLTLQLLGDIRQGQAEDGARLERLEREFNARFTRMERDMRDLRNSFMYVAGAATIADHRVREVDERVDDLDEKMKALEAALAEKP
jgi:hypothetical protein